LVGPEEDMVGDVLRSFSDSKARRSVGQETSIGLFILELGNEDLEDFDLVVAVCKVRDQSEEHLYEFRMHELGLLSLNDCSI
jgi:hypothetical protein